MMKLFMLVDLLLITDQDDLKKKKLENLIDLIVRYHPGIIVSSPKHGFTGTNQVYVLRDFDCNFIVSESFLTVTVSKQLSGRIFFICSVCKPGRLSFYLMEDCNFDGSKVSWDSCRHCIVVAANFNLSCELEVEGELI